MVPHITVGYHGYRKCLLDLSDPVPVCRPLARPLAPPLAPRSAVHCRRRNSEIAIRCLEASKRAMHISERAMHISDYWPGSMDCGRHASGMEQDRHSQVDL